MFHQLSVGEAGVRLQNHEGNLRRRTEDVPASQSLLRQAHSLCHTLKRKYRIKFAKLTLMKTLAIFFYDIKFCKAQSWGNFQNILYLRHILVGEFSPFGLPNLICGGIPKNTKKPTNSQYFVYELVGVILCYLLNIPLSLQEILLSENIIILQLWILESIIIIFFFHL